LVLPGVKDNPETLEPQDLRERWEAWDSRDQQERLVFQVLRVIMEQVGRQDLRDRIEH